MKLLIVGDAHFKEKMAYGEYIPDGRRAEKKEILNFILAEGKKCDGIVFLGDQFHLKNNPSEVVREFVEFVEAFGNKEIYMLAGNHEKFGDGKSAIDFMREVNKPNWHIFSTKVERVGDMVFCPYFFKGEMGTTTVKAATQKLVKSLPEGRILFAHHAVSDMKFNGMDTNLLQEIVLPRKTITKKYEWTAIGHIHVPVQDGNVTQVGSVFNNEVGEDGKFVNVMNIGENITVDQIPLPGRKILKFEDPDDDDFTSIKNAIVKVVFSKSVTRKRINELKGILEGKCDAYIIVEKLRNSEREKAHMDSIMSMSVEDLLKVYAKEKKISPEKLLAGFQLIQ